MTTCPVPPSEEAIQAAQRKEVVRRAGGAVSYLDGISAAYLKGLIREGHGQAAAALQRELTAVLADLREFIQHDDPLAPPARTGKLSP
jgi:hypothetical protein